VTALREKDAERIDTLMEKASRDLAARRYFDAERLCAEALARAHVAGDYERMSRIVMPLEEARRQKRDLAFDAGTVTLVTGVIPSGRALRAGCYLLAPPRVGVDGRALREIADRKKVPTIIIVREPTTRDGLWPIVAIGPVTFRARVRPPEAEGGGGPDALPTREWMIDANEALGDAAIEQVPAGVDPYTRSDLLYDRVQALPDHEKLHQLLADACREAARSPRPAAHRRRQLALDELEAEAQAETDEPASEEDPD
jgi:hypothetical protein